MAGELNNQINQLKIKVRSKEAEVNQLKELLSFAEQINQLPTVTPTMTAALLQIYQELTS